MLLNNKGLESSFAVVVPPPHVLGPGSNSSINIISSSPVCLQVRLVVIVGPVPNSGRPMLQDSSPPSVVVSVLDVSPSDNLSPSSLSLGEGSEARTASGWAWVAFSLSELIGGAFGSLFNKLVGFFLG